MSDLISRQAAIKAIENLQDCYNGFSDTYDKACIIGVIEEVPPIEPTKHGRWIEHHEPFSWMGYTTWTCSECDYEVGYEKDIKNRTDYCPNCGTKMDSIGEDKSHPFAESVMMGMRNEVEE